MTAVKSSSVPFRIVFMVLSQRAMALGQGTAIHVLILFTRWNKKCKMGISPNMYQSCGGGEEYLLRVFSLAQKRALQRTWSQPLSGEGPTTQVSQSWQTRGLLQRAQSGPGPPPWKGPGQRSWTREGKGVSSPLAENGGGYNLSKISVTSGLKKCWFRLFWSLTTSVFYCLILLLILQLQNEPYMYSSDLNKWIKSLQ